MALSCIRRKAELEAGLVLAPERYDPRRTKFLTMGANGDTVLLHDIVELSRRTVNATSLKDSEGQYLVLDTCDAFEGVIVAHNPPIRALQLGSAKKLLTTGDVVISRLRPYLRQVALVDCEIPGLSEGIMLASSTEFFVLRSRTENSIAFLVPYLLSSAIQSVLAVSQEGGHHPRFTESTLLSLPIPMSVMEGSVTLSRKVERRVAIYRESERLMVDLVREIEQLK